MKAWNEITCCIKTGLDFVLFKTVFEVKLSETCPKFDEINSYPPYLKHAFTSTIHRSIAVIQPFPIHQHSYVVTIFSGRRGSYNDKNKISP